jgi:hypothetical protein
MSELNPQKSIDVLLNPNPLKLGEFLILDKFECPCIEGNFSSMLENGFACWLLKQERKELFAKSRIEALAEATEWIDTLSKQELFKEVEKLVEGIGAFYDTLPKADESQKKNQTNGATD